MGYAKTLSRTVEGCCQSPGFGRRLDAKPPDSLFPLTLKNPGENSVSIGIVDLLTASLGAVRLGERMRYKKV